MTGRFSLSTKWTKLENGLIRSSLRKLPATFRRYGREPVGIGVDLTSSLAVLSDQLDNEFIRRVLSITGSTKENLWFAWVLSAQYSNYRSYYKKRKIPSAAKLKATAEKFSNAAVTFSMEMHRIFDQQLLLPLLERQYQAYVSVYKRSKPLVETLSLDKGLGDLPVRTTPSGTKPPNHRRSLSWLALMDEITFLAHAATDIATAIQTRKGRQTNTNHNLTVVCLIADAWVCAGRGNPSAAEGSKFYEFVEQIGPAFGPFPRNIKDALKYWRSIRKARHSRIAESYGNPLHLDALRLGEDTIGTFVVASETATYLRARKLGVSYSTG